MGEEVRRENPPDGIIYCASPHSCRKSSGKNCGKEVPDDTESMAPSAVSRLCKRRPIIYFLSLLHLDVPGLGTL
jgi:hypothetical protein